MMAEIEDRSILWAQRASAIDKGTSTDQFMVLAFSTAGNR